MALFVPILTLTGSDGTGGSGIQADIKTCGVLGGYALTVVTAVTVQDTNGIQSTHHIPSYVIDAQATSILQDMHPKAVKVGMVCDTDTVNVLEKHLRKLTNIVLDTAFISSRGEKIAGDEVIDAVCNQLMPLSDVVIIKLSEAEMLLKCDISNSEQLQIASRMLLERYGMRSLIIQNTRKIDRMRDDYFAPSGQHYSVSPLHGVSSTLAAAIATNLANGNTLDSSVTMAYRYMQTLTVYSVNSLQGGKSSLIGHGVSVSMGGSARVQITPRQQEIYNTYLQLIANHSHSQHDVRFYADRMNITSRYLLQVVMLITGNSPKRLIADTLVDDAVKLLTTTTHNIQEIAFELGFSSQAQFAKFIKRMKGRSPSSYRS